jgi:GNAT superfamily N-acetyltransferase
VNNEIRTRRAAVQDTAILAAFNVAMAEETEARQLDLPTVTDGVRNLFERPEAGFYLVAEVEGQVAGSLMVTFEWSDWRNKTFWWIQSVYVQPAHRRRGIFTRLFRDVQQIATARQDVCGLRLYVEQHNHVAQATYKSLGMDETHYDMYEVTF